MSREGEKALFVRVMYKIPLRELKTRKIKVKVAKPRERVAHLLSTHVVDTRRSKNGEVFFASLDEAKRRELAAWHKLEKSFSRRTKRLDKTQN